MSLLVLASTTSAANSDATICDNRYNEWLNYSASPILSGSEVAQIQKKLGTNWVNTGKELSASENDLAVYGPGIYRVAKPATASATEIHVCTPNTP